MASRKNPGDAIAVIIPCAVFFCALTLALPLRAGEAAPANPPPERLPGLEAPPAVVRREGKAEWRLWYTNYGTRSEGMHGMLVIDGEEYVPRDGEGTIATDLGTFTWNGAFGDRRRPWDRSGWLPADEDSLFEGGQK